MKYSLFSCAFDAAEAKVAEHFGGKTCSLQSVDGDHECPICYFRLETRRILEPLFSYSGPIHHILRLVADDVWSAAKGREAICAILSGEIISMPSIQADTPHIPNGDCHDF